MRQMIFSAGMRPGIAKVGSASKDTTIATKAPFDFLDSLCFLFLRNFTLVGGATVFAAICLSRFSRYSCSCYSWVLVVPLSHVGTAWMRKAIPDWRSLVVLHVLPVRAEIWGRRASMLALMLDAGALGAIVMPMLPFLLWRTPIGSTSLLLHFVSSSMMMLWSFGKVAVMSVWLPVVMTRSLSSLGYVLARAGGAAGAWCGGLAAAAVACAKVFAFPLPFPNTSTQSLAWILGALDGAGVLCLSGCSGLDGYSFSCAYSIVV